MLPLALRLAETFKAQTKAKLGLAQFFFIYKSEAHEFWETESMLIVAILTMKRFPAPSPYILRSCLMFFYGKHPVLLTFSMHTS